MTKKDSKEAFEAGDIVFHKLSGRIIEIKKLWTVAHEVIAKVTAA